MWEASLFRIRPLTSAARAPSLFLRQSKSSAAVSLLPFPAAQGLEGGFLYTLSQFKPLLCQNPAVAAVLCREKLRPYNGLEVLWFLLPSALLTDPAPTLSSAQSAPATLGLLLPNMPSERLPRGPCTSCSFWNVLPQMFTQWVSSLSSGPCSHVLSSESSSLYNPPTAPCPRASACLLTVLHGTHWPPLPGTPRRFCWSYNSVWQRLVLDNHFCTNE